MLATWVIVIYQQISSVFPNQNRYVIDRQYIVATCTNARLGRLAAFSYNLRLNPVVGRLKWPFASTRRTLVYLGFVCVYVCVCVCVYVCMCVCFVITFLYSFHFHFITTYVLYMVHISITVASVVSIISLSLSIYNYI